MAACPAGAGRRKGRPHFARWLLGRDNISRHKEGSRGAQPYGRQSPSTVSGNDVIENQQRDSSLRGGASRGTGRKKRQAAPPIQNDAGLQNAAMVCVTVRWILKKSQPFGMTVECLVHDNEAQHCTTGR